ncbi:MAG TPA: hypothetical protein VMD31_03935 [Opitutaceae bacterium]|nr:hypothetical protein [Opitutaceae bacterium]
MTSSTSLKLLGALVLVAALSLVRYAPAVTVFNPDIGFGYGVARVPELTRQLADPAGWASRPKESVALRWRLLPPTVGHLLRLKPAGYFALPLLGAAILLALAAGIVHRETRSVGWSALTGALLCTASWFFVATGWLGQFDVFYLLGLVAIVFAPSLLAVGAACALGPWCDERFLLILPACLCLRWARSGPGAWRRLLAVVAVGLAPYVLLRLWAAAQGDASMGRQLALQGTEFRDYLRNVPDGWWMGFRLGWVLIGVGVAAAFTALPRAGRVLLILGLVGGVGAIGVLAWDVSRSIAALLPFLVFGVIALHRRWPRAGWRILAVAAALNFILPAKHVVETHRIPIRSIWPRAF